MVINQRFNIINRYTTNLEFQKEIINTTEPFHMWWEVM